MVSTAGNVTAASARPHPIPLLVAQLAPRPKKPDYHAGVVPRLAFLFALYMCQGLPGGFLAVVLPVVLREQGLDLTTIGFASALSVPWVLKILWAPLVDRFGSTRFGRRRSWLVPAQLGMLAVTVALATLEPASDLRTIALLFLVLNMFAATQDIAVDGWAVSLLKNDDLGPANGAQVSGFKVGNLLGGGVLVALLGTIGWAGDCLLMAGVIAAVMLAVLLVREPPSTQPPPRRVLPELWRSIRGQGAWFWAFIVFAKFAETFGGSLTKPMLVDRGYSKALIGTLDGVVGALAVIGGAALAGVWVRRHGWARVLVRCSIAQGVALVGLGLASVGPLPIWLFVPINVLESAAGGGVAVSVFALAMGRADRSIGASDFTASQVFYMTGAFLAAPLGGALADACGSYLPSMAMSGVMAVGLGVLAPMAARRFEPRR